MKIDPMVVVDAIADATSTDLTQATRHQLALALSYGRGIARRGNKVYVLLRDIWQADTPGDPAFRPTLIVGDIPLKQKERRLRSASQIAGFFRTQLHHLGTKPAKWPLMAPIASDTDALVPLAGDGIEPEEAVSFTEGARTVTWHDLTKIPLGGIIYRVDADMSVRVIQSVGPNSWVVLTGLNGRKDIVPLPAVLHRVTSRLRVEPEGFTPPPAPRTLLRQTPKQR